MARLALVVDPDQADVHALAPVMHAGVDLLVLGDSGDVEADAQTIRDFREQWARTQLLLGTAHQAAGEAASADLVHTEKPGWFFHNVKRPHEWSLMGRGARDARAIRSPGDDYDYLFVGPTEDPGSRLISAALEHHPVFTVESLPWFVLTTPKAVPGMLEAGARRIALGPDALRCGDPVTVVADTLAQIDAAWQGDPAQADYRSRAFRL